jgi:ribosomal protein L27
MGRDCTLYAGVMGIVKFQSRQRVTIEPVEVLGGN